MEKLLTLGFIGKFPPAGYRDNIPLRIENILKEYSNFREIEVVTGLFDTLEICTAKIVLRLRETGCKISLKIVLTNSEQTCIVRNMAKGRLAPCLRTIYENTDTIFVTDRSFTTVEQRQRMQEIIDSSDILFYCASKGNSGFCSKIGIPPSMVNIPNHNLAFDDFSLNNAKIEVSGLSYIWKNRHIGSSNQIPSTYLLLWRSNDPMLYMPQFQIVPDLSEYILETHYHYAEKELPLYVFFLTYIRYLTQNDLLHTKKRWTDSWQHFLSFQRILNYILDARARGRAVPEFNIFDFSRYNEFLTQLPTPF